MILQNFFSSFHESSFISKCTSSTQQPSSSSSSSQQIDLLSSQPSSILKHIFTCLTILDLYAISLVCKRFNQLSCDDNIWKACFQRSYPNTQSIYVLRYLLSCYFHNYPTQTWYQLAKSRAHLEKEYPISRFCADSFEELVHEKLENQDWTKPYNESAESERDIITFFILERYETGAEYSARRHAKLLMTFGQRKTSLPLKHRDFLSAEAAYIQCLQICRTGGQYLNFIFPPALLEFGYVLQQRAKILSSQIGEEHAAVKKLQDDSISILTAAEVRLKRDPDHYVKLYNLACLASIRGEEEECQRLLLLIESQGHMAQLELMCRDANFDNVRDRVWFQEFIQKHFQSPIVPNIAIHS